MQVSIPLQELLDTYKKSNALYLCHHVMNVLHISFFKNDIESVVERNIKNFFAKYFKFADSTCSTLPFWFGNYDEDNLKCYYEGTNGEEILVPWNNTTGRDHRIIIMEHVLKVDPFAVLSFNI